MAGTPWACTRLYRVSIKRTKHRPEGRKHTTKLLCPVLKVCHIRLTPLVGDGVVAAPLRGDPPKVAARVLSLGIVAHGCFCVLCGVVDEDVAERQVGRSRKQGGCWSSV